MIAFVDRVLRDCLQFAERFCKPSYFLSFNVLRTTPNTRKMSVVAATASPKPLNFRKREFKVDYNRCEKQLKGNVWYVRGFHNGIIQMDDVRMNQSVHISECLNTKIVISNKVNNVTINRCTSTQVELVSVISSLEIVNGNTLQVKASGSVPCVQIDLTQNLELTLKSWNAAESNLVNASSVDVYLVLDDLELKYKVPTSMFADQFVSRVSQEKKLLTLPTSNIKHTKSGLIDLSKF